MSDQIVIPDWVVYLVGRLTLENELLKQPAPPPSEEQRSAPTQPTE